MPGKAILGSKNASERREGGRERVSERGRQRERKDGQIGKEGKEERKILWERIKIQKRPKISVSMHSLVSQVS